MKDSAILAIDTGTTSIRGVLFDTTGTNIGMVQVDNPPVYYPDGRVEQDPRAWRRALSHILTASAAQAQQASRAIAAISLTSQRSSVIAVSKEGEPLFPALMWQDVRTASRCTDMAEHKQLVYARTGLPISPVFSAIKMQWLKEEQPDVYQRSYKLIGIQDYLIHSLTGRFVTDRSLASRTNLFNLDTRDWDDELIKLFGIEKNRLCDLVNPGQAVGSLSPEVAAQTGLTAGIPVISAGGDQQCAALGMGLLSLDGVVANTGTGSYVIGYADRPIHDPQMRLFCNVAAVPGMYVLEAASLTAGVIYRWFTEQFYQAEPAAGAAASTGAGTSAAVCADRYDRINAEASAAAPGSGGLLFLPYFKGSGAPAWNPDAKGTFYGLTLSTTRGDMARAILEGIVADMAENLSLIESLSGPKHTVIAAGGLTRLPEYNRIQANLFGRPVTCASESEATALGAFISAAVSLGLYPSHAAAFSAASAAWEQKTWPPQPDLQARYRAYRDARRALIEKLFR